MMTHVFQPTDLLRFKRLMSQYKLQIKSKMQLYGKWATGQTWNSIEPYAEEVDGTLSVGLRSIYPIAMKVQETGRKPGRVPREFETIIYEWSMTKGIQFKNQKERMKFASAVKWKTIKEGSIQFKSGTNTDIFTDSFPTYDKQLSNILDSVFANKAKKDLLVNFL